ncbi:sodium:solute symporter family protein [Petroclostridium sp. X23]|uniref:sodium:solute symporter family protein n=1 Tax=Petroclostridium sp. X23 TaxID=3045146 RepID=UPI0024AD72EA|nr:sodium:solute symporter family protein [Petroclostridium sp. X23]WHH58535.1 sodium:solute symporter family protein [Petroclostridium sp. X23]
MSIVIITTLIYLVVVAFLGFLGYKHTKDSNDYMIGGRKIHPMVMALSYGATFISTSAIVGFGGAAGVFGMGLLWLTFLNIFVGIFVAFALLGKRTRKMGHNLNAHTFPELLAIRFQSKFIQKFAGAIIFLFMPLYAAAVMIGATHFLATAFGIDYNTALFFFAVIVAIYVSMGGMKGVMYSDAFQASIMFIGMIILLGFTYKNLGGVTQAHIRLGEMLNNAEVQKSVGGMVKAGFQGWSAMPKWGSPNWWTLVSTIVMGVGIGVLAQPQLAVRFMTVKSNRELNRAVPIGGIFILMMTGVAFIVGALSNVYFFNDPNIGKIALLASGNPPNPDNIIPLFIKTYLPEWFGSIFLITMLAAGMSTLSSQFHAMGTAIGRDLFYKQNDESNKSVWIAKIGVLFSILVTTFLAYFLPVYLQGEGKLIIASGTALFFGLCAASFLPVYIGALYFRNMPKIAAISGIVSGFVSSIFWMLFVHEAESKKLLLCKLIFGVDTIAQGTIWRLVDPIFIALPISIIVTIGMSLLYKCDIPEEHLKSCYQGIEKEAYDKKLVAEG